MKLSSIAVSNIRSFEYDPDFTKEIAFDDAGLNLLIGPNASGKSNLVEIIMRIFSNVYDITGLSAGGANIDISSLISTTPQATNLQGRPNLPGTFTKHRATPNQESSIKLTVTIDAKDKQNLGVINRNRATLKRLYERNYKEYTDSPFAGNRIFESEISSPRVGTTFEIVLREHKEPFSSYFIEDDSQSLVVKYLRDYGLICTLIDRHNELLNPSTFNAVEKTYPLTHNYQMTADALGLENGTRLIQRLSPPLILVSVQERLSDIDISMQLYGGNGDSNNSLSNRYRQIEQNLSQKTTQGTFSGGRSETFESLKTLIWIDVAKKIEKGVGSKHVVALTNSENTVLLKFNNFLQHFRLRLLLSSVSIESGKMEFTIQESGSSVNAGDISSGQRAIINIAASLVVGDELKAMVLIDEIENHLHPTVQARLRDALIDSALNGSQSIAVTHSPIFVTAETLKNTIRLYIQDGHTVSKRSSLSLTPQNKAIFDILDYTNGSRVFFSDKVILVEGISDEELFVAYLRRVLHDNELEILKVRGDGSLAKWRTVIEDFGVKVYIVADLDTLLSGTRKHEIRSTRTKLSKTASVLWTELTNAEQKAAIKSIKAARGQGRYILQRGALEAYIPTGGGDKTDRVRLFIEKNDWSTLKYKRELRSIFTDISRQ